MNDVVKAIDGLDRWVCITPPRWAKTLDQKIVLGSDVCHPQRGLGSIVSFDGFERVHVLYEEGNDMYRRYSEEGWISKMSIGKVVTNPNVKAPTSPPKLVSRNLRKNKVGVGERRSSQSRSHHEKVHPEAYSYGNDAMSMGLSGISATMSFGDNDSHNLGTIAEQSLSGKEEGDSSVLEDQDNPEESFAEKKKFTSDGDEGSHEGEERRGAKR